MDRLLARRVESDPEYRKKLVQIAKNYLKLGRDSLAYWSLDFDASYDTLMCFSQLTKKDFEQLERGHPKRFVWPMTATQIATMTTYIAQVLFGQEVPWKVEGRGPEDQVPAEFVNQLLRWNSEQQMTYMLGFAWIQDALSVNRGIFYNSWAPIFKTEIGMQQIADGDDVDPATGQPKTFNRARRKKTVVGGFNKIEIVSPYDFYSDPQLPLWRLQEHRFAGHKTTIPITELRRRSLLPIDHPAYVIKSSVEETIKKGQSGQARHDAGAPTLTGGIANPSEVRLSRSAYERSRTSQPTGEQQADKHDSGNIECIEMWIRLVPSEYKIYSDEESAVGNEINIDDEPVIFQFLIGAGDILLSINESTYQHGQYPYSVAEGRPHAHWQFSPSWIMMLRGIQDHVDWLKNRHQEALSRTIGNIFIVDPSRADVTDFMNPDKEGLLITLKPEAYGSKISDIVQQVPIKDMTAGFHEEAMQFMAYAETVTAANSAMQGTLNTPGGEPSATQFSGTMQMGAGRLTSIARLLSSQALVPQSQQFVANFQQFMAQTQVIRFKSDKVLDLPPELQGAGSLLVNRDVIQGSYDYIAHDGTLPGTDSRKVAAGTRLLEVSAVLPQIFEPGPGNLDPRKIVYDIAKAAGLDVSSYTYDRKQFEQPQAPADPRSVLPPVDINAPPAVAAPGPETANKSPGPKPSLPQLSGLSAPSLDSLAPPQVRPGNQ